LWKENLEKDERKRGGPILALRKMNQDSLTIPGKVPNKLFGSGRGLKHFPIRRRKCYGVTVGRGKRGAKTKTVMAG